MLNHFPNHYELTRKSNMVKNIKRYRKALYKAGSELGHKNKKGLYVHLDFLPHTFDLPGEYTLFIDHFKNNPNTVWIVKPTGSSQGRGIFLVNSLYQFKKWFNSNKWFGRVGQNTYVCCRYIDNPLLIGGKKFDLRLYVLVTSYNPLVVWYVYTCVCSCVYLCVCAYVFFFISLINKCIYIFFLILFFYFYKIK